MTRPCDEIEAWLGQPREALSEAQRLTLEQHLSECAECRALHAMSRTVAATIRESAGELSSSARERAIARALTTTAARVPARRASRRMLVVSGMAAAALFCFFLRPDPSWLEGAGTHGFAHAMVTMSPNARVRFDEASTTLTLDRGALEVEVDPKLHAPFAVQTAHFRALVLGTSFHVDAQRVSVRHGHVRVMQGERVLADLHAGEQYDVTAPPHPAPEVAPPPEALPATDIEPPRTAAVVKPASKKPAPHAREALSLARAALARDALDEARQQLRVAEQHLSGSGERAEAGTLRAEIALREGNRAGAIDAYLAVANAHSRLASGENALFAAAQLSAPQAARPLLERYLQQYPGGRFAAQVRARLQAGSR